MRHLRLGRGERGGGGIQRNSEVVGLRGGQSGAHAHGPSLQLHGRGLPPFRRVLRLWVVRHQPQDLGHPAQGLHPDVQRPHRGREPRTLQPRRQVGRLGERGLHHQAVGPHRRQTVARVQAARGPDTCNGVPPDGVPPGHRVAGPHVQALGPGEVRARGQHGGLHSHPGCGLLFGRCPRHCGHARPRQGVWLGAVPVRGLRGRRLEQGG
mmetsp:Transcript_30519/g.58762  ORF Transcript_30519/g.58762 Transcript_30519/m.58762 type:complete len:209 (-) Transcript_30519:1790-2416(-)